MIGIPKTIYRLSNCTLTPSSSGRASNLTHMLALPKVDFARAGSRFSLSSNNVHLLQDSGAEGTAHVEKAIYSREVILAWLR